MNWNAVLPCIGKMLYIDNVQVGMVRKLLEGLLFSPLSQSPQVRGCILKFVKECLVVFVCWGRLYLT